MHAWIGLKCCVSTGHRRTDLLSPIRIIVRMPEPENLKIDDLLKSVKVLTQSRLQVTWCTVERYCLLHVVVQGPGSFASPVDFPVGRMVVEIQGVKVTPFSDFGLFSPYKTSLQPMGYITEWLRFLHVVVKSELWSLLTTYRKSYMGFSFKEPIIGSLKPKVAEIRHLENCHDVIFFSADGGLICRMVQRMTCRLWRYGQNRNQM